MRNYVDFPLLERETAQFQYPRTWTMDWPWASVGRDLDRAMTQPVKGIFTQTCEEVCFEENIGEKEFLECVFAKNGRECMALRPPTKVTHPFNLS